MIPPREAHLATPYFGYGSNLDPADWAAFCLARGFDAGGLRPLGPAVLRDERLVFDYHSVTRGCGALNIRGCRDASVSGYLFAVSDDAWAALDVKEGHPDRYAREDVIVVDAVGGRIAARTYRVVPAMRRRFCAPSDAYLAVCRAGRIHFGLSLEELEAAAANRQSNFGFRRSEKKGPRSIDRGPSLVGDEEGPLSNARRPGPPARRGS